MKKTNAKFLPNAVTKYNIGKYQGKTSQVKNLEYKPGRNLTPSDTSRNAVSSDEINAMMYNTTIKNLAKNKNTQAMKAQADYMKAQGMSPKARMETRTLRPQKLGGSTKSKKGK